MINKGINMYKMYGIPNCNTVKKAMVALDKKKITYEFINFKKEPPSKDLIKEFKSAFGDWPVNKKGPTYRKIKDNFESATSAGKIKILMENTSAIKRPILFKKTKIISFGFDEDIYQKLK